MGQSNHNIASTHFTDSEFTRIKTRAAEKNLNLAQYLKSLVYSDLGIVNPKEMTDRDKIDYVLDQIKNVDSIREHQVTAYLDIKINQGAIYSAIREQFVCQDDGSWKRLLNRDGSSKNPGKSKFYQAIEDANK